MDPTPEFCVVASASTEQFEEVDKRCSANEVVVAGVNDDNVTCFIIWNYVLDTWIKWKVEPVDMIEEPVIDLDSKSQVNTIG